MLQNGDKMRSGSSRWDQSRLTVLLASILFPPLGLILIWKQPRGRIVGRMFATLGIAVLAVAHLVVFWGLRVELSGGMRPMLSFDDPERRYQQIEEERASEPAANPTPVAPPYWTEFRGPNRDAHYREMEILTEWPDEGLDELWRKPVGEGYASFSVAGGMAFTIEQRRDEEVAAAYDMATGREVWTNSWQARFEEPMGGPGPRATPTWHENRLYVLGAEGEFRCLDAATGETLWRKNILEENGAANLQWAMAASPLVVDDKVVVLPGGPGGRSVVAYDRITGDTVWSSLSDQASYTSPMLATLAGQRQIIVVMASRIVGITVENGELLWEHPWSTMNGINVSQPLLVGDNRLIVSAGYGHGAEMLEVLADGGGFEVRSVWESNRMKNKFNGSVLLDGYVYGLDEGILAAVDAETGELAWKGGRYGYGQLMLASGHLIVLTERGDVVLVRATPESHQEVASFHAIDGKTWNTPAISAGRLLVRNAREMACYRIG